MTIEYPPISPPRLRQVFREWRTLLSVLRLIRRWRKLSREPMRTPRTIVLIPGFGATVRSLGMLSRYLGRLGHTVHDWGLGRNHGRVAELMDGLRPRVRALAAGAGEPLVLLGWSLGGYLAREIARDRPDDVLRVITLGTPVVGGPRYTLTARWYARRGWNLDELEQRAADRFSVPIRVPVTAVYTKHDGVVSWEACVDRWSPDVRHIEVDCSHIGFGFDPGVFGIVAGEIEARGRRADEQSRAEPPGSAPEERGKTRGTPTP